jgi:hypothetical protein
VTVAGTGTVAVSVSVSVAVVSLRRRGALTDWHWS